MENWRDEEWRKWEERRNKKGTYIFYGLVDPRDMLIYHVGQTKQKLRRRLYQHIFKERGLNILNRKGIWIQELIDEGLYPLPLILEIREDITPPQALELEAYHMQSMIDIGMPILSGDSHRCTSVSSYDGSISHIVHSLIAGPYYRSFLCCTFTTVEQEHEALRYSRECYKRYIEELHLPETDR